MRLQKECKICGEVKAIDLFYQRTNGTREPVCRKCRTAEERRQQNATPAVDLHAWAAQQIALRREERRASSTSQSTP